jgi:hypothetical protein
VSGYRVTLGIIGFGKIILHRAYESAGNTGRKF